MKRHLGMIGKLKDSMSDLIKIIPGFMSVEHAETITSYAKKYDSEFLEYGNGEKEFTFHASFNSDEVADLINDYGVDVLKFVRDNYPGPFSDYDKTKTHIARFQEGFGMHEHFDSTKPNDIATLIYINTDYEGGEIYFPDHNINFKPGAGDLVCFPDTPDFVHGVRPILNGTRYTIPRWFTRIV